jgi:hypothetical protein
VVRDKWLVDSCLNSKSRCVILCEIVHFVQKLGRAFWCEPHGQYRFGNFEGGFRV